RSRASASSPSPWNAYGDVRGLNAPPRRTEAPASRAATAAARSCSSDSTEHGPATSTTSGPPIATSPLSTIVAEPRRSAGGKVVVGSSRVSGVIAEYEKTFLSEGLEAERAVRLGQIRRRSRPARGT